MKKGKMILVKMRVKQIGLDHNGILCTPGSFGGILELEPDQGIVIYPLDINRFEEEYLALMTEAVDKGMLPITLLMRTQKLIEKWMFGGD